MLPDGDYKKASPYFRATGGVNFYIENGGPPGGHAFIVSSATGGVIEATAHDGQRTYYPPRFGYGFKDFADGVTAFENPDSGAAYGARYNFFRGAAFEAVHSANKIEQSAANLEGAVKALQDAPEYKALEQIQKKYPNIENMPDDVKAGVESFSRGLTPYIDNVYKQADTLHDSVVGAYSNAHFGAPQEMDYVAKSLLKARDALQSVPNGLPYTAGDVYFNAMPVADPTVIFREPGDMRQTKLTSGDMRTKLDDTVNDTLDAISKYYPDQYATATQPDGSAPQQAKPEIFAQP